MRVLIYFFSPRHSKYYFTQSLGCQGCVIMYVLIFVMHFCLLLHFAPFFKLLMGLIFFWFIFAQCFCIHSLLFNITMSLCFMCDSCKKYVPFLIIKRSVTCFLAFSQLSVLEAHSLLHSFNRHLLNVSDGLMITEALTTVHNQIQKAVISLL